MSAAPPDPRLANRSYGRRYGRSLRASRRRLLDEMLPALRVPLPAAGEIEPRRLFPKAPRAVWLEVGFGGGEHLAAQAEAHPEIGFIGCEPFVNGVASLLAQLDTRRLGNVRLLDDDARLLIDRLSDASIGRVFVLFADPWPKARHAKRRFIRPEVLDSLARIMADDAELRFASDDMGYVRWALERLVAHPGFAWPARRPVDWRRPPPGWCETRYEAKAKAAGRPCAYLTFRRRPRP
ncbi:MAG: tRNA (guanine(46)-N(7))-methyltransferase TrmB [Rhodospirillales bacterium]|nr:tRNA (guanine(46)-N(7))-methyltransferase TrmB [Rhodospirillales bacterium]